MSKSLSELVDDVGLIERMLLEGDGEITEEIEALIADVDLSLPHKIDSYAWRLDRLQMATKFYEDRAKSMKRAADIMQRAIEHMRHALQIAMVRMDTNTLRGQEVTFRLQNAPPAVVVDNEGQIPGEYITTETVSKIDKRQIAAHLKLGLEVNGAHLEQNQVLRTYVDGSRFLQKKD